MTKLNRVSKDICLFGSKGSGKTLAMTYYAFRCYIDDIRVFSNFKLRFPFFPLKSLGDIKRCYNALVLLDDLESWLSSRNWKSKENQEVMQIILQGGKRKLHNLIYSAKRPENIDLLLRDTTDYWCKCSLVPNFKAKDVEDFENKSKHLENLLLKIETFDDNIEPVNITYIGNLRFFANLYSTFEEIGKLDHTEEKERKAYKL